MKKFCDERNVKLNMNCFIKLIYFLIAKLRTNFSDDEDRAKSSLRWLISLNKSEFDLDKVTLEDKVEDETDKKTFMEAVKELWIYK